MSSLVSTRQVSSMIHSARPIVTPVANVVFGCFVFLDLKSGDGRTYGQHVRKQLSVPAVTFGWPSGSIFLSPNKLHGRKETRIEHFVNFTRSLFSTCFPLGLKKNLEQPSEVPSGCLGAKKSYRKTVIYVFCVLLETFQKHMLL